MRNVSIIPKISPEFPKFPKFRVTIYCLTQFIERDFVSPPSSINRRTTVPTFILPLLLFFFFAFILSCFPSKEFLFSFNSLLDKIFVFDPWIFHANTLSGSRSFSRCSLSLYFIPILIKNSFLYLKFLMQYDISFIHLLYRVKHKPILRNMKRKGVKKRWMKRSRIHKKGKL